MIKLRSIDTQDVFPCPKKVVKPKSLKKVIKGQELKNVSFYQLLWEHKSFPYAKVSQSQKIQT